PGGRRDCLGQSPEQFTDRQAPLARLIVTRIPRRRRVRAGPVRGHSKVSGRATPPSPARGEGTFPTPSPLAGVGWGKGTSGVKSTFSKMSRLSGRLREGLRIGGESLPDFRSALILPGGRRRSDSVPRN